MTPRSPMVSIVIPTFRRPLGAVEAARSALAQDYSGAFEIVLVDNDPGGSALDVLGQLRAEAKHPLAVIYEPRAGVANARNAGVRAASGKFIAFLDDDEVAQPRWLSELLRVQAATRADVVFGPVNARLEPSPKRHRDFFEDFFSRDPDHDEGLIRSYYGCGCSLIRRAALPSDSPFSAERNEIGGEDDLMFETLKAKRAKFAWAPTAYVFEAPDPARVTLKYTLRRAFAFGQGPATRAWSASPRRHGAVAWWMLVGLAQTLFHGVGALIAFAAKTERRAFAYRRLAEGLGKLLWFPSMKPRFYGASRLPKDLQLTEQMAA
jgi:glycosyltransferase involved in cell wall biosynthesis